MKSKLIVALIMLIFFNIQCSEFVDVIGPVISRTISVRPATSDDCNALLYLSHQGYQNYFKPLWKEKYAAMTPKHHTIDSFVQEKADLNNKKNKEFILNQTNNIESDQRLLVAELTETRLMTEFGTNKQDFNMIVGFCRFEKKDPKTMYINFILIDEAFRKRGIAKQLAQKAMKTFDDVTECKFRALVHNDSVNDLYIKHGCEQIGRVSLDPSTGEISTDPNAPITHYDYSYTIKK